MNNLNHNAQSLQTSTGSELAARSLPEPTVVPTLDLSIVIPIYNESGSLPDLSAELAAVLSKLDLRYEILAVDDGSRDDSVQVLRRLQKNHSQIKIVQLRRNFGQTAAFAAGFDMAQGAIVITIDADGQNDPADIPRVLAKMEEGYDIVSGWRAERKEPFLTRRLPSILANRLISQATDVRLHDYGCSLKAYRLEVVKNVQLYGELHRFIPALAARFGVHVAEIPVNDRPRKHGQSKYGLSRTIRVILDLLTVTFLLSYGARPMQLFGFLGLISAGVGALLGLYLVTLKIIYGYRYQIGDRPLLMLAVLLVIIGVQFVMMGLLGEIVIRTYHEAQNKPIYFVRTAEERGSSPASGGERGSSPASGGERGSSPASGDERGSSPASGDERGSSPASGGERGSSPASGDERGSSPASGGERGSSPASGDERGSSPASGDERGSSPASGDERGSSPASGDERGSSPASGDERGSSPASGDERGSSPASGDERGSSPASGDERGSSPASGDERGSSPASGDERGSSPASGDERGSSPASGDERGSSPASGDERGSSPASGDELD